MVSLATIMPSTGPPRFRIILLLSARVRSFTPEATLETVRHGAAAGDDGTEGHRQREDRQPHHGLPHGRQRGDEQEEQQRQHGKLRD